MPTELLSGSTGGRPIKVAATATPGTLIHATGILTTVKDRLWLFCQNTDTVDRKLTLEFGGVTSPDDLKEITIPAESGDVLVCAGLLLTGDGAAARNVRAFAAAANVLTISGYVERSL